MGPKAVQKAGKGSQGPPSGKKKTSSSPSGKKSGQDTKGDAPKKRKKKSSKLKDLTDEEKAEFKEKKSAAQQEVQRRREELITIFLKTKIAKEEEARRLNGIVLNEKWRQTMRKMKTESLRNQAKLSAATFERVSSKKDEIINSLMSELEEAEEQQNMVDRAHLSHVARLLDTHRSRVEALKTEYETERNKMLLIWDALKNQISTDFNKAAELLRDVRWATEKENKTKLAALHEEFSEKHQSSGIVYTIRLQAEAELELLNKELEKILKDHQAQTNHKWATYTSFKTKDEEYQAEFDNQVKEIRDMTETIGIMKRKLEASTRDREHLVTTLKAAKADYQAELQADKGKVLADKQYWQTQTKRVTLQAESLRKKLFECDQQLDRILKLGSHCRKVEVMDDRAFRLLPNEAEKILATADAEVNRMEEIKKKPEIIVVGSDGEQIEIPAIEPGGGDQGRIHQLREKACTLLDPMEPFWRQYGRVNLQTAALSKQNQLLKKESELIKDQLRRFFERMRLSDNAVLSDTTLMPIAKAPTLTEKPSSLEGRPKSAFPSSSFTGVQQIQPHCVRINARV